MKPVKPFSSAEVGDDVYTWEVADGHDWGDYLFETVDPTATGADDMDSDIIRKRWRLVEIVRLPSPRVQLPDDEDFVARPALGRTNPYSTGAT